LAFNNRVGSSTLEMACCCVGEDSTRSEALSFASSIYIYIYIAQKMIF